MTARRSDRLRFGVLGCAAIGFADDYLKIARKRSLGLTGRQKLLGQAAVGLRRPLLAGP